jgi:hypothetical protein
MRCDLIGTLPYAFDVAEVTAPRGARCGCDYDNGRCNHVTLHGRILRGLDGRTTSERVTKVCEMHG